MSDYNFFIFFFILNYFLFYFFLKIAKKIGFVDTSKKFNNPITATSAGIIFYINTLIIFFFTFFLDESSKDIFPNNFVYTYIAFSILIIISTIDDLKPIDPKIRLFFQLICVYLALTSIKIYNINFPLKLTILISLIVWVYIVNITNFTDGSDGFLATNTIFLFINLIVLDYLLNLNLFSKQIALVLLPSIIIFLYFNKPNAKLYMGDSGSILIGFINGFIFLELITNFKINLAITLLIYPILDCSLALIRKTLEKKLPWVDISNYSFLQPTIKSNKNKFFVFYFNIFFNILNSSFILLQILFGWYYIVLNFIIATAAIIFYEKK